MVFNAPYLKSEYGDSLFRFWEKLIFTLLHGKFENIFTWEHFRRERP